MRKFNIIPIIILLAIFVVLSNKPCRLLGEYWTITCLDIDWLISLHSILFYSTCLIGSIITCLYQVLVSCSPFFCTPTGYSKKEVIGKNCHFLQAPAGQVSKGDVRRFTSQDTVAYLTKSSMADKECQTSIVNYEKKWRRLRRSGRHYPCSWWCRWQFWWTRRYCLSNWIRIGFQVDLFAQPDAILEKLRDGCYIVDYASPLSQCRHQNSRLFRKKKKSIPFHLSSSPRNLNG